MKTVNLQQLVLILILLEVGLLVVRLEKRACISFCVLILILLEVGLLGLCDILNEYFDTKSLNPYSTGSWVAGS